MPSHRSIGGWMAVATVVLAGCSGGAGTAGDASTTSATGTAPTSSEPATSITSDAILVALAPDRLIVGGNALVYGAPRSQVRAYLDRALGPPTATEEQECGPARLESFRWDGITVYIDGSGFAGWSVDDDTFATNEGIRIGSDRRALEAAHPATTVTETSLGTEFFVPGTEPDTGISGIYEGDEVGALWSGATCVAR